MTYQKVNLSSQEVVGSEGIPRDLRGLSASTLADLAANLNPCPAEYVGFGFFPIAPSDQEVPYDKVKQGRTVVMTDSGPMYSYNLRDKEDSEYPYQTPEEALVVLTQHLDALTSQIQSQYPDVVQMGWEDEEAMAKAYLDDTATQEQEDILGADAAVRGRTPEEHANRILENAQLFRGIVVKTRSLWLSASTDLEASDGPKDYEGILNSAKETATVEWLLG